MHNHVQASPIRRRPSAARAAAALLALVLLGATACGGSAEVAATADEASNTASTRADTDTSSTQDAEPETEPVAEAEPAEPEPETESASSPRIGQGTFELVLENGETYTAPVGCVLDPQIAAGSEILFTAAGQQGDLFYDVTQWGETSFGGTQSVEIVDTTSFDNLWRSTGSTGLVLELNGNVITGSGGFYPGEALNGPQTQGELTVTC